MSLRLGLLILLWLTTGIGSLHADLKRRSEESEKKIKNPIQVPEVRAVNARFIAGGSVELELIAMVASLRPVEFIIRQGPEHGTLSEIRRHPRESNRAYVTYTHASKTSPIIDSFTYSCRLDDGPFSAPGRVTLVGQKYDPILRVDKQPAFNRIFAGGVSESEVVLENVGAAPFEGRLQWQAPFQGPDVVKVPPGGKVELKVSFRPDKAGHFHVDVPLVGNRKDGVIELYGDSIPALTVSPGRMVLKFNDETKERVAILTLGNGKPEETEVKLKLPQRLMGATVVKLAAQGREDVKLFLPAKDVEGFQQEIEVVADGVSEKILVSADPQPANLALISPAQNLLDFGTLEQKSEGEQELTIANKGGQDLLATFSVLPPFSIEESEDTIRLQPGQERRFLVKVDTRAAGFFESNLEIAGSLQKVTLKARATVKAKMVPQSQTKTGNLAINGKQSMTGNAGELKPSDLKPRISSTMIKKPIKETPIEQSKPSSVENTKEFKAEMQKSLITALLAHEGIELQKLPTNPHLPQVQELRVTEMTQSNILLSWPQPKVKPVSWRLEAASNGIKPESGMLVKFWSPISNWQPVEVGENNGMMSVNIDSLKPGAQYEFRVLGVDQEGKVSRPSPSILVTTLPEWRVPAWIWRSLVLAALGTVLYLLYRLRRGDFEFEH